MAKTQKFTFGKSEKLKSRKQIDQLFKSRKFVTEPPVRLFYQIRPIETSATALPGNTKAGNKTALVQAGFSCSKKFFKQATRRNRVKRLMREAYRHYKTDLWDYCTVNNVQLSLFWLYGQNSLPTQTDISNKVEKLIAVLINKLKKQ